MDIEKEIENVLKKDKSLQYEYFIKKCADFEKIWSLKDEDGWATLGVDDKYYFPIWPKREFAERYNNGEWEKYFPAYIDLEEFIETWIDGLKGDNIRITVMWNNGKGIDVDWEQLKFDLLNETENYM